MLYEELWVKSAVETEINGEKCLVCDFVGHGLNLTAKIRLCSMNEYKYVIKTGALIHCEFAYQMHSNYISLGIVRFKVMQGYNTWKNERISAEDYMNPRRGYWVHSWVVSNEWIQFNDGILILGGNAFLPLPNDILKNGHLSYEEARAEKPEKAEKPLSFSERLSLAFKTVFSISQ